MNVTEFKTKALEINPNHLVFHRVEPTLIEIEIKEYVNDTFSKLKEIEGWRVADVQDNYGSIKVIVTFKKW